MQKLLSHISPNQQTILIIIGLPLILLALGLWQLTRAPSAADIAAQVAQMETSVAQLRELARTKGPMASVKLSDGRSYGVQLLISRGEKEIERIKGTVTWEQTLPGWFARLTAACGGAALLLSGLVLLHIRRMGAQALKSRAKLLREFQTEQKFLPWFLGSFAVLLFTAAVCGLGFEVLRFATSRFAISGELSRNDMKLIFLGGLSVLIPALMGLQVVWNIIKASRAVFQLSTLTIMGRAVSEQDAPILWNFVRGVAGRVNAEVPDTIVVGLNKCFFVTEGPVKLSTGTELPRGRLLYLPIPFMAFMSKPEVATVIGHELAHFTGDDTEYSQRFSPIYSTAVNNIVAVREVGRDKFEYWMLRPISMLGEYFLRAFNEAVQYWSRQRELAADKVGAHVASPEAMALALIRVSVIAPRINEALSNCWREGGHGEGVLTETRRLVAEQGLGDPAEHLEDAQAHPTDSHPTTRQRVEALGVQITPPLLEHCRNLRGNDLLIELGLEADEDNPMAPATGGVSDDAVPVTNALEAEFSSAAQSERDEHVTYLLQLSAETPANDIPIQEGVPYARLMIVLGLAAIISPWLFAGPGLLILLSNPAVPVEPWLRVGATEFAIAAVTIAAFTAGGLLLLAGRSYLLKRCIRPVVTLTANGLLFADLASPVPWPQIENYRIEIIVNYIIPHTTLTLTLAEGYELPSFKGDRRVRYGEKKRQIYFSFLGLTGISMHDFAERINIYRRAVFARAELEKIGMRMKCA
jgi:Zn-dependent protease with chaperone function